MKLANIVLFAIILGFLVGMIGTLIKLAGSPPVAEPASNLIKRALVVVLNGDHSRHVSSGR